MTRARSSMQASLRTALALLFAATPALAHAAEPQSKAESKAEGLTLEAAIGLAEGRVADVIRAKDDVLLADVERMKALAAVLPRVDLRLDAGEAFGGSPIIESRNTAGFRAGAPGQLPAFSYGPFIEAQANDYSNPQFSANLSGQQLLYDGGRWWTVIARAKDLSVQAKAALAGVSNDARLAAVRRFYELEKARRSTRTFEVQIAVDQQQLERVRALVEAGRGKQADVSAVERNLAEDRITLARRRHADRSALRALNLALGRPSDEPAELVLPPGVLAEGEVVEEAPPPALDALAALARRVRPELVRSKVGLDLARKDVVIARADYLPQLTLGASYSRQSRKPGRIFDDPTSNYYANLGLTLRWNLFSGRATDAAVETADLQVHKAEVSHAELERNVLADVSEKRENLGLFLDVYRLARESVRASEEAVRLARGQYEAGRGTLLELRDAELRLTLARLSVIEARLDLEIGREDLRHAVGADPKDSTAAPREGAPGEAATNDDREGAR